jgi:ribose 5-phosphate isomerase B
MEIALGADHAGFDLKEKIKGELQRLGHGVRDLGTDSDESVDYPDYAARVCRLVTGGQAGRGILVCGTGVGMSVAANKLPGIRAANVCSEAAARLSREHNDANVLTLGARLLDEHQALGIVRVWLETGFLGGRHQQRIEKIAELERKQE